MARYWVYLDTKTQGPFEVPDLRKVPGFNLLAQVCAEGEQAWRMADEVIEIKSYFLAPPRARSAALEIGNAALRLEPEIELPEAPEPVHLTVVEPGVPDAAALPPAPQETVKRARLVGMRVACGVCGYKNPRDVKDCMKCGTVLQLEETAGGAPAEKEAVELASPKTDLASLVGAVKPAAALGPLPEAPPRPTIEIPVARIAWLTTTLAVLTAALVLGIRHWQKPKAPVRKPVIVRKVVPMPVDIAAKPVRPKTIPRQMRHARRTEVGSLPGVAVPERAPVERQEPQGDVSEPVGYRVLPQAAPLKVRDKAPLDSPYAQKLRADTDAWVSQEDKAISLVQKKRIYGGLRTVGRNADILMQILRDREYVEGFESGRRPYLYNQTQWSASPKRGPVYEVQLVFSGGREADGSPRKPLKFAFEVDLERGSVKPGGDDQIQANTMHAFYNESRIPPEERRAIAKDTEGLVLAAAPGGSPLALETVLRQFVGTYNTHAAQRVATAFTLPEVLKKLKHDPVITQNAAPRSGAAAVSPAPILQEMTGPASAAETPAKPAPAPAAAAKKTISASGTVDFQMQNGPGRSRNVMIRVPSRASPARMWEILTSYDHLMRFVPDMLLSEREGQDGSAIVVHTQNLARVMFFVFKMDLHLRVIEHPQQTSLEFERLAGEFESFRGSVEIAPDPSTFGSVLQFRATLVPKGRTMNWSLREATRRYLVPLFEAVRAQAESN